MAVSVTPWAIDSNTNPAVDARRAMAASLGCDLSTSFTGGVGASDPGHGVCYSTDLKVTQNGTPNMSVNVASGSAFIRGTQAASQGVYHAFNDATANVTIAAADATNARRDLIVLQVRDAAYSGASRDARLVVVQGTPAASPADPSLSSTPNALVLARVTVAAGATSITSAAIADLRTGAGDWFRGRGRVTSTQVTTAQTGMGTSIVDITNATVTVAAQAYRRYKVSGECVFAQAASATTAYLQVMENGVQVASGGVPVVASVGRTAHAWADRQPGAGNVTWKLMTQSDTGTINTVAGSTYPVVVLVEDIGAVLA